MQFSEIVTCPCTWWVVYVNHLVKNASLEVFTRCCGFLIMFLIMSLTLHQMCTTMPMWMWVNVDKLTNCSSLRARLSAGKFQRSGPVKFKGWSGRFYQSFVWGSMGCNWPIMLFIFERDRCECSLVFQTQHVTSLSWLHSLLDHYHDRQLPLMSEGEDSTLKSLKMAL